MIISVGGTGFIGKHLNILMHEQGIKNFTLSRSPDFEFLDKHTPSTTAFNLGELDQPAVREQLASASALIYLASSSVPGSAKNTVESELELNVSPAISTISKISSINPNIRIIFLSSGGTVYGPGHSTPISETQALIPSTPYSYGKIAIEHYLELMANTSNLSYTILRASNPVGKWHKNQKQGFIGSAIENIRRSKPVKIFGNGETVRDYINADELALAILSVINQPEQSKNEIYNVGSGTGTSLNEILEHLHNITNTNFTTEYLPSRETDLNYNVLDCQKIKAELNWAAQDATSTIIENIWNTHA